MKRLVISEKQEKKLIELLSEEDKYVQQMPVDSKSNKPYCIDPAKVLTVKKHLDKRFKPCKYSNIVGGRPKTIKIGCMLDDDGNALKYMYQEDMKDYLIDYFQKMFLDHTERDLFMGKVLDAWFNNKIGVHGTLDVNHL
jgi:hypothetical protein